MRTYFLLLNFNTSFTQFIEFNLVFYAAEQRPEIFNFMLNMLMPEM